MLFLHAENELKVKLLAFWKKNFQYLACLQVYTLIVVSYEQVIIGPDKEILFAYNFK